MFKFPFLAAAEECYLMPLDQVSDVTIKQERDSKESADIQVDTNQDKSPHRTQEGILSPSTGSYFNLHF